MHLRRRGRRQGTKAAEGQLDSHVDKESCPDTDASDNAGSGCVLKQRKADNGGDVKMRGRVAKTSKVLCMLFHRDMCVLSLNVILL